MNPEVAWLLSSSLRLSRKSLYWSLSIPNLLTNESFEEVVTRDLSKFLRLRVRFRLFILELIISELFLCGNFWLGL